MNKSSSSNNNNSNNNNNNNEATYRTTSEKGLSSNLGVSWTLKP